MTIEYKNLSSEMKIFSALGLKERTMKKEDKKYDGLTKPELYELLGKLDAGLNEKEYDKAFSQLYDWGLIKGNLRFEKNKKPVRTVMVSPESQNDADTHLRMLDWLKENYEITVKI